MHKSYVHILRSRHLSKNEYAFLQPIRFNRKKLASLGICVRSFSSISSKLFDCSILIVTSKFARENNWWNQKNKMFQFFARAKSEADHVIWADLGDSTGATHFEVLPYVDRYFKGAILKNKELYLQFQYGSRFFTHYYHEKYGIEDSNAGEPHLNYLPKRESLEKIHVSWNQAFCNYTHLGFYYDHMKRNCGWMPELRISKFTPPSQLRTLPFSCRISSAYGRNTVAFQRSRVLEKLQLEIPTIPVNRRTFFAELKNSLVVISPFGWGEICYRDFEAMMAGAALMKPNCEHLVTWPNFYQKDHTYISFDWDLSDFGEKIEFAREHPEKLLEISTEAQKIYRFYFASQHGKEDFCRRVADLLSFQTGAPKPVNSINKPPLMVPS